MEFKSNFNITNKSKVKIIEQLNEPVSWTSLKEPSQNTGSLCLW